MPLHTILEQGLKPWTKKETDWCDLDGTMEIPRFFKLTGSDLSRRRIYMFLMYCHETDSLPIPANKFLWFTHVLPQIRWGRHGGHFNRNERPFKVWYGNTGAKQPTDKDVLVLSSLAYRWEDNLGVGPGMNAGDLRDALHTIKSGVVNVIEKGSDVELLYLKQHLDDIQKEIERVDLHRKHVAAMEKEREQRDAASNLPSNPK